MTVLRPEGPEPTEPPPEEQKSRWNTPERRKSVRNKLLIGLVVAWAVAITVLVAVRDGNEPQAGAAPAASPSDSTAPLTVAQVYQTLAPSVVLIQTTGHDSADKLEAGTGTGVIANADGTVLTALHVVDGAENIQLTYSDGTKSVAVIASKDPEQDIATITPQKLPETLVPAVMGGGTAIGDDVVAIGNPLGLTWSTSSGVVSGLERTMNSERGDIEGLIQFDAAVNPGNSGGPLINTRGQVVGIVIALANPTNAGTFIGIGFAVPIGAALGGGDEGDGQAPPL